MEIQNAKKHHLHKIIELDKKMIGSDHRKDEIHQAIKEERCLILYEEEEEVAAFLIYHTHFFDCCFISLIMVDPAHQRKGLASSLLTHMSKISPTNKLFSSTNESNESMKKVFIKNHFKKSGFVDNLDEGDPEIIYFKKLLNA
ncbi:GNAT family N-acetyltransferase [Fictibacillus phosphorivorans]|uniref:GNAT family N-acetyltransferase n=1 Tax=Fictibacillus phosphorivorans TaxID=1221500 RepID=UPI00129330BA|nr:GNAT family N-acetyltransferase [Fictibacillus phosphorivorans]MQR95016.1 GNAT family N-acetyltransferase [Fictibacillus phosphorivorans]